MFRTLINLTASCALLLSSIAHAGIVIESTRYLYKEGAREITAQIENKDDIPYLIKSGLKLRQESALFYGHSAAVPP